MTEHKHISEEMQKEMQEQKQRCEEYLNGWKRERADFLNYKKEEMERIGNLVKYANQELILNILPILDNIYLAESHIPDELKKDSWIEGFLQIQNQVVEFLKKEGIEEIKAVGGIFDPNLMEAVEEIEDKKKELGTVIEEVQKGYTMHGKVIRAAKVKISK